MAIIQRAECDICEAEIPEIRGRHGFPQMSWCFYREAKGIALDPNKKPVLQDKWMGKVNRMEFCQKHGEMVNVLLKALFAESPKLMPVLDELVTDDRKSWGDKMAAVEAEHADRLKEYEKALEKEKKA